MLFHGTGIYCLAKIVCDNALIEGAHWGKQGEPHGPRLSRCYEVASSFCQYNMPEGEGGVLVLDNAALMKSYVLQDYQDRTYGGDTWGHDEKEVVVVTPEIGNLSRYLLSISVAEVVIEMAAEPEMMELAAENGGWPFGNGEQGRRHAAEALSMLRLHPLINALPDHFPPVYRPVQPTQGAIMRPGA